MFHEKISEENEQCEATQDNAYIHTYKRIKY